VATSVTRRGPSAAARAETLVVLVYGLAAVALAGEAVVHVEQYFSLYHGVRWIGPLFLLDALGCVAVIAALAFARTRELAAMVGVLVSALALGALVVSYGRGLFGWQEAGFKTPVELVVIFEVAAVVLLAAALGGGRRARTVPTLSCPTSAPWASRPFLLSRSAKPDPSETVPRATAVRPEVGP